MHRASEDTRIATENKGNRRNLDIRVPRVRVIGADGEQVGVLSRDEALAMAQELALDLVEKINAMLIMRNYEGIMKDTGTGTSGGWGRQTK